MSFTPGQKLRASDLWVDARKASDQTIDNSTTLANCTDLGVSLRASKAYELRGRIQYRANASTSSGPDIKFGWTFPTGLTMAYTAYGIATGSTTLAQFNNIQTTVLSIGGFSSDLSVVFEGTVLVGTTAGTLQFQFAQNTLKSGNGAIVRAQSFIVLTMIS